MVFELGLFMGRLGKDRAFMLVPRGSEENHLPTDLLGLTPASYDADRQDKNLLAAVGPGCNRLRKAIAASGLLRTAHLQGRTEAIAESVASDLIEDKEDCLALIEGWMGARPHGENSRGIRFADVDRELKLKPGSAKLYLKEAATRWDYLPKHEGKEVISFIEARRSF